MPKVIFTVSYEIHSSAINAYISLADDMKKYLTKTQNKNFSVYQMDGKENLFTEFYICENESEYETLEDSMDDDWNSLQQRLQPFIVEGTIKCSTFFEK